MQNNLTTRFILPVLLVMGLDGLVTILGQSADYWTNFASANESHPLGNLLLSSNPILFVIIHLVYMLLAFLMMKKLPIFWGIILGLSLFLGHAWGSSSWLGRLYFKLNLPPVDSLNWYLPVAYFVLLSLTTSLIIFTKKRKNN